MSGGGDDGRAHESEPYDETADLVRAAAAGDKRAAGEYFAQNLQRLSAAARKIAGTSADPGDLLGDAILVVFTKWMDGTGPTGNVNAYVSKIMRNRLLDELKSPRSRVQRLDFDDDPSAPEDARVRRVELAQELGLVRRALAELPTDQRDALLATVVEGHKPRDLEGRLDRPASAIYSLSHRAKENLRRTMLQLLLSDDAALGCEKAARRLPRTVGDSLQNTLHGAWFEHYRTCSRCGHVWARFGGLAECVSLI